MTAYYNEFDDFAAKWLQSLIAHDLIAPGDVDTRSIKEVQPDDLKGYDQCHFFAGIGGWSHALRLAGWGDDRPVWTGSCPCQPFSAAGQRKGTDDPRHLWPEFLRLIADGNPTVVFGEQVASPAGRNWLAGVRADLETLGYAVGAADLCAAGVGAPNIRQRLWWVADADGGQSRKTGAVQPGGEHGQQPEDGSIACGVAHASAPREGRRGVCGPDESLETAKQRSPSKFAGHGKTSRLGDTDEPGPQGRRTLPECPDQRIVGPAGLGFWGNSEIIPCADGKARRIEPGTFPLAHGVSNRVGLLRGYGNAINPEIGQKFITAYCETHA